MKLVGLLDRSKTPSLDRTVRPIRSFCRSLNCCSIPIGGSAAKDKRLHLYAVGAVSKGELFGYLGYDDDSRWRR